MNILIVGAGIGGLTAALCLVRAGHRVRLFERTASLSEVGAGLQCGANAVRVFDFLGLMSELNSVSVRPRSVEFRDGITGASLYRMPLGQDYQQRYDEPYLHVHRADLQTILFNALNGCSDCEMEFGVPVVSCHEQSDQVSITLQDGRVFTGDGLIGADGIRSIVRQWLVPGTQPRFTGNVAWRGVIPVESLPKGFMPTVASNFMGPGKHMVLYYLRAKQLLNFVGVVEDSNWTDDSWVVRAPWEVLKAEFAGWHPMVQTVIDVVDKNECYRWALYDHKPLPNWSSQRITLLGDAAHATLPFMASGAAMAIEDARILQRALEQADDLPAALQLYQRNRLQRTARVQRNSARFGKIYHIHNRWLLKTAFKAVGVLGREQEAFLPQYDANTVKLV